MAGIGRGAAVAGEAAGEGAAVAGGAAAAEAGGAGLLMTVGLPAVIIAAVGAALVWMMVHPDKVRAAAKAGWELTKDLSSKAASATKAEAHALPGQVKGLLSNIQTAGKGFLNDIHTAGGIGKVLQLQAGPIGDISRMVAGPIDGLAKMVAGFEGHVKNGYGVY